MMILSRLLKYNKNFIKIYKKCVIYFYKMKISFLTFGGGAEHYYGAVQRICRQASAFELFKKIYGFTYHDLKKDT